MELSFLKLSRKRNEEILLADQKNADLLFDLDTMQTEFPMLGFSLLKEETITLEKKII